VKDSTDTAEPEESNVEDANVETLDFNVSAVSSFEEKQDDEVQQSADDSAEELETFSFDTDASITAQEPVVEELDEEPAEEESLDSLTAALDKINAEESDIVILDNDATSDSDSIDDLDLGDIEIDDSVFIIDDEDDAVETGDEPISDSDESSTKLDLAVAYEAMGDKDGAKEILNEVVAEGNEEQVAEAKKLLEKWG
ncbi:MAG: pilus assembly protein FimV, partial [Pseudohongiellaceae bacterium]